MCIVLIMNVLMGFHSHMHPVEFYDEQINYSNFAWVARKRNGWLTATGER